MAEIKEIILDEIKKSKEGISCLQLSKKLNKNRITVAKYLEILKANDLIESKQIAQAKIWTPKTDSRTKILIIDDEPNIVTLITLSLNELNANIVSAYDGLEGLQKVYEETPDIIILDLMMPRMSGYDVYEKLKASKTTKDIPIIILTAKAEGSKKLDKIMVKPDTFMTKPFDPIELGTNIKLLLSKKDNVHPITKLDNESSLIKKTNELLQDEEEFYLTILKFKDVDSIKKNLGYTKLNDIIKKFAKVVQEATKDNFIKMGHSNENNIILLSKSKSGENVKNSFESIAKYLTNEDLTLLVDEYDNRELKVSDPSKIIR